MRKLILVGFILLAGGLLLLCSGDDVIISSVWALLTGWIAFPLSVAGNVTVNFDGLATGVLAFMLFLGLFHGTAAWLYGQSAQQDPTATRKWKPGWTAAFATLVVVMFVAGISIVGVVHQIVWLSTTREVLLAGGRPATRSSQSKNNLKQIGLAIHNYHDTMKMLPPGATFDAAGEPQHGWQARLLPYVDQAPLYNRIDFNVPWNHPRNWDVFATVLPAYQNPGVRSAEMRDDRGNALSHYAANARVIGGTLGITFGNIKDGTSHTLLAGEVATRFKPWGHPLNMRDPALGINQSADGFGGPWLKRDGAHFLFADGSVRFLAQNLDPKVLKALSTPAGAEPDPEF